MTPAQARHERHPLDDPGFLSAARAYVRGVDGIATLLQFVLSSLAESSSEWRHLKFVHVMLDGMASAVAGQLVARGERLVFGAPPSPDLIALAFEGVQGQADDHDALSLCEQWCRAIDDVLWYLEAVGVVGSKRSQEFLAGVLEEMDGHEALTALSLQLVGDALSGLRVRMVARLSAADDGYYLKQSKKPVSRLPTPVHRLLSAGALGHSK